MNFDDGFNFSFSVDAGLEVTSKRALLFNVVPVGTFKVVPIGTFVYWAVLVWQVLLTMEANVLSLHFTLLDIHLVTNQHDRNVVANARQITMPVRHVLVCNARGNVKHNDRALTLDVVSIA